MSGTCIINNSLGNYEREIVYIRFMKNGKVERVARTDTTKGIVSCLMPSDNPEIFLAEQFANIDDNSEKVQIERKRIKDKIWLKLLNGNHYYCPKNTPENKALAYRVFRISDVIN